jgi:hypothetical protein
MSGAILSGVRLAFAVIDEVTRQTPPNGDTRDPYYRCPSCHEEREVRADLRAHLFTCDAFATDVFGAPTTINVVLGAM